MEALADNLGACVRKLKTELPFGKAVASGAVLLALLLNEQAWIIHHET